MSETGISEQVINEIRKFARRYGVRTVTLFGSRARGEFNRASDIDLAVDGGDILRFALDVDEETSTLLKFDIIDMGQPIQEKLRNAICEEGIIIYEEI